MPSSYRQNVPKATSQHYLQSSDLGTRAAADAQSAWDQIDPDNIKESWHERSPQVAASLRAARVEISLASIDTNTATLAELGEDTADAVAQVDVRALVATTSAGSLVSEVLDAAPIRTLMQVRDGVAIVEALASTRKWIGNQAYGMVQEAGGDAAQLDTIARPQITGYVRMLTPPSCARCVMLAGRWYRWNDGFERHPGCDCVHIPASEYVAGDIRVDPKAYFDSLDKWDWDDLHINSKDRAAIEAGANPITVLNTRTRGAPVRRNKRATIDDIMAQAGNNRGRAIQLLRANGYYRPSRIGIPARIERTGARNPLNPDTMTSAERRLYQAWYRLDYMRKTGFQPRGLGTSSADKSGFLLPTTRDDIAAAEDALDRLSNHALTQRASQSLARLAQRLADR